MASIPEAEVTPLAPTNIHISTQDVPLSSTTPERDRDSATVGSGQPLVNEAESSCYYDVLPTPYGGRGAFAKRPIPRGTVILKCQGPYASVVLRKFRKEVCAWCFAWCFESGGEGARKGSWNVRLDSDVQPTGGSEGKGKGKGKMKEKGWTTWFCGEECREEWVKEYSWNRHPSMAGLEGSPSQEGEDEIAESRGSTDNLVDLMASLEKTLTNYKAAKTKAKSKATGSQNSQNTTLSHPLTFLESWTSKAKWDSVTEESIDWWWTLAEDATSPKSMKKPGKIMEILEAWNDKSADDPTELLTEFEADGARFVLDGLIRQACQSQTASRSGVGRNLPDTTRPSSPSDATSNSLLNVKTTGNWPDLLRLQNNELQHIRSKPYMLGVFIRIFLFLKYIVLSARPPPKKSSRPQPPVAENPANCSPLHQSGISEAAVLPSLFDTLADTLVNSHSVRAILARDHGNVFGIWEKGSSRLESLGQLEAEDSGDDGEMFGWGMYVFGSYFNHDCTPSVRKMQHGRSLYFATTRDIEKGEELCINYIDVSKSNGVVKRNEELSKEWFFECGCGRCARERELVETAPA